MSEITHSFTPATKIDACCDLTSSRYALGAVEIIPAGKDQVYASATDGHCASMVLCQGTAEGLALLPAKLAKPDKVVELNGRWECNGKVAHPMEGRFPRLEDVLPDVESKGYTVLGIDAKLLKNLADALNSQTDRLTLFIPPNSEKHGHVTDLIAVRGDFTGIGAIMPVTPDKDEIAKYTAAREAYNTARKAAIAQEIAKQTGKAAA